MRKLITMTISALAVGAALLTGTGPAHADIAPVATQSSGSGSVGTAASEDVDALSSVTQASGATVGSENEQSGEVGAAYAWYYHSWHWTKTACANKGSELVRSGQAIDWGCPSSWPGYELRVFR